MKQIKNLIWLILILNVMNIESKDIILRSINDKCPANECAFICQDPKTGINHLHCHGDKSLIECSEKQQKCDSFGHKFIKVK